MGERPGMNQIPFAAIRAWLFQAALPFWAAHGIDARYGGFLEELTPEGGETSVAFKRVRVPCRQTYVFSHAALLGWDDGAALSARGYDYILAKVRRGEGCWAHLLSRQGDVIDATPTLYDFAFVMHAFAWRHRLTGDPEPLRHAHATLDFVQRNMRAAEGFWPTLPAQGQLLQNPHMHMLEAQLALFEATGEERFLDQAAELVALFRRRMFTGRFLRESFDGTWTPDKSPLEPGHQFEWVWLLAQYQRLSGESCDREAAALADFTERAGVDAVLGTTYDAIAESGDPVRRTSRTWPNTERIKAHLSLFELTSRDPRAAVAQSCAVLLDRYLKPNGAWIDTLDADGAAIAGPAPASTFYHVFLAFAEVLRLEPLLRDQTP